MVGKEPAVSKKDIEKNHHQTFESLKETDFSGSEFWTARQLAKTLEYSEYRHFLPVVEKAKIACFNSGHEVENHFEDFLAMVPIGSGAQRELPNIKLSRYACYLIVQNADPSKPIIANGQTYFAIQTRRQELNDDKSFRKLQEDDKRIFLRNELKEHNKQLVATAQQAGVETNLDFAVFQNHGYKGLYGGLDAKAIHARKALKKSQKILDYMGSTELAANLFRATQTEEKLRRENIQGKAKANKTHHEVGAKVRKTIKELGGTMPEDLLTPDKSAKKIEGEKQKLTAKVDHED
jgi:DNA-damage-inducible protein D